MARTPSRRKTDEHAFPVRVRFRDREPGPDWIRWSAAETWLVENVGKGHFAKHGDGGRYDLYFRTGEAAHRFILAFPHFRLFDLTEQVDYLRAAQGLDGIDAVNNPDTHHGKVVHSVQAVPSPKPARAARASSPKSHADLRREIGTICDRQGNLLDRTQSRDFRAFVPAPPDERLRAAGPVRTPAERMAFGRWLLRQDNRDGLIGELIECAKADRNFPRDGSPEAVREHLRHATADGDMFAAIDEAEVAWTCG